MKLGLLLIILGLLGILFSLWGFFISGSPSYLFVSSFGAFFILIGIFGNRYHNNYFYLSFLGVIIFQGIILNYIYFFKPVYTNESLFYFNIVFFMGYVVFFYLYVHSKTQIFREIDKKLTFYFFYLLRLSHELNFQTCF